MAEKKSTDDKKPANYVRVQKGHSITAWVLISLLTDGIGLIWVAIYSISKNHYWHA